jgi:hypothetical protein
VNDTKKGPTDRSTTTTNHQGYLTDSLELSDQGKQQMKMSTRIFKRKIPFFECDVTPIQTSLSETVLIKFPHCRTDLFQLFSLSGGSIPCFILSPFPITYCCIYQGRPDKNYSYIMHIQYWNNAQKSTSDFYFFKFHACRETSPETRLACDNFGSPSAPLIG